MMKARTLRIALYVCVRNRLIHTYIHTYIHSQNANDTIHYVHIHAHTYIHIHTLTTVLGWSRGGVVQWGTRILGTLTSVSWRDSPPASHRGWRICLWAPGLPAVASSKGLPQTPMLFYCCLLLPFRSYWSPTGSMRNQLCVSRNYS